MKRNFAKEINRIRESGFFDPIWYLKNYPDVRIAKMDPAEHFHKYGCLLRRDPGPNFSTSFYLDTRPGCEKKGINPLTHYLTVKSAQTALYNNVLWASYNLSLKGDYDQALELLDINLPKELHYTKNILLANRALVDADELSWINFVNDYLKKFGIEPVLLSGDGHLLSRLTTRSLPKVSSDEKITVIMPAWNAEMTVQYAAESILNQTWRNLELIIVDDASQDNTWAVLKSLGEKDSRVKIMKNKINVGPYVSKNKALQNATGKYVTGQDADDWAHPQRLERHISLMKKSDKAIKASLTYMIRIQPDGFFGHIGKITGFSFDGVARKASISCLFEKQTLMEKLGFWDSVRFGADSEMIARAKNVLGSGFAEYSDIGMICLDLETSLTNHMEHGVDKINGVSPIRKNYRDSWMKWHTEELNQENAFLDFPLKNRRYSAGKEMQVNYDDSVNS